LKAGVAQIGLSDEIRTNMERILSYLKPVASLELDILCFPECCRVG